MSPVSCEVAKGFWIEDVYLSGLGLGFYTRIDFNLFHLNFSLLDKYLLYFSCH